MEDLFRAHRRLPDAAAQAGRVRGVWSAFSEAPRIDGEAASETLVAAARSQS